MKTFESVLDRQKFADFISDGWTGTLDEFNKGNMLPSIQNFFKKTIEPKEQWLKEQLLLVEPPIKGEITKGKLKWRGIKLCSKQGLSSTMQSPFMNTTYWVEQRGKKIGVEYVEQFNLNVNGKRI